MSTGAKQAALQTHGQETVGVAAPDYLPTAAVAVQLGVSADKVRGWIHSGKLLAHDFSPKLPGSGGNPRYYVHAGEVQRFLRLTSTDPALKGEGASGLASVEERSARRRRRHGRRGVDEEAIAAIEQRIAKHSVARTYHPRKAG